MVARTLLLLALASAALLPTLAQQFTAAEVAAAKPWHFVTKEEGQARAHRLRKAHPALRRQLFTTWKADFAKTYKSGAHEVREQGKQPAPAPEPVPACPSSSTPHSTRR